MYTRVYIYIYTWMLHEFKGNDTMFCMGGESPENEVDFFFAKRSCTCMSITPIYMYVNIEKYMCMHVLCIYTWIYTHNAHMRVCTTCTVADQQSPAVAESPLTFNVGQDKGERFTVWGKRGRERETCNRQRPHGWDPWRTSTVGPWSQMCFVCVYVLSTCCLW